VRAVGCWLTWPGRLPRPAGLCPRRAAGCCAHKPRTRELSMCLRPARPGTEREGKNTTSSNLQPRNPHSKLNNSIRNRSHGCIITSRVKWSEKIFKEAQIIVTNFEKIKTLPRIWSKEKNFKSKPNARVFWKESHERCSQGEWARSPMVGQSSGTLPTSVQILHTPTNLTGFMLKAHMKICLKSQKRKMDEPLEHKI
jgi:hypothetical protein